MLSKDFFFLCAFYFFVCTPFICSFREIGGAKNPPQYVLLYPSASNYYVLRQDQSGTSWWMSVQNWFQQTVSGGSTSEESGTDEAPAEGTGESLATKTGFDMKKPIAQEPLLPNLVIDDKQKDQKNDKFFYLTPASTQFLNTEKRLFTIPQQTKFIGTISGPILNPVFNLQPIPTLGGRSNIANTPDESQPLIKVISENTQKFSQIPPVMTAVEPVVQPVLRSHITEAFKAANPEPENRIAPVEAVQTRAGIEVDEEGKVGYSITQDVGVTKIIERENPILVNSLRPLKVQSVVDLRSDVQTPVQSVLPAGIRRDDPVVLSPLIRNNVSGALVDASIRRDDSAVMLGPSNQGDVLGAVLSPAIRNEVAASVVSPIIEPKVKEIVSVSQSEVVIDKVDNIPSKVV